VLFGSNDTIEHILFLTKPSAVGSNSKKSELAVAIEGKNLLSIKE
jgi:hypothetical protein